jgi:acylneuraminate cytidylyltransferase
LKIKEIIKMSFIAIIPMISSNNDILEKKEILMLGEYPLSVFTIKMLKKVKECSKIIVITNSLEYKSIVEQWDIAVLMVSNSPDYKKILGNFLESTKNFGIFSPLFPFRDEKIVKKAFSLFKKNQKNIDFLVSEKIKFKEELLDFNKAFFFGKIEKYLKETDTYEEKMLVYPLVEEDSIVIKDRISFELAISIYNKRKSQKILEEKIKKRIKEKYKLFTEAADITLVGHSIFDNWNLKKLKNKKVSNLGIGGISTEQYQKFIFDKKKIKGKREIFVIIAGTNDIVNKNLSYLKISEQINKLIDSIYENYREAKVFLVETPSVAFRIDRKKEEIFLLNKVIQKSLRKEVQYIPINSYLVDTFGNLKLKYTYDGLHFTKEAYKKLKEILEKEIKI